MKINKYVKYFLIFLAGFSCCVAWQMQQKKEDPLSNIRYHLWNSDIVELRFFSDVAFGNLNRRAVLGQMEFFIAMWVYEGLVSPDRHAISVLKENSDVILNYFNSAQRKTWFFKTFSLTKEQTKILTDILADAQRNSSETCTKNKFSPRYKSPDVKKNVIEWNNTFLLYGDEVTAEDIEYSFGFQYEAKGRTHSSANGDYNLLYLLPNHEVVICPMTADDFLREQIHKKSYSKITMLNDGFWILE
ncbi:MAG: hypothetical protein IJX22_04290 [Opitutales bacterium]|nr:hypothetical protein [Opitutales bacterium]